MVQGGTTELIKGKLGETAVSFVVDTGALVTLFRKDFWGKTSTGKQVKLSPWTGNAPATLQRLMDLILARLNWSKCLVFIDDVIILGSTFEDHLHTFKQSSKG